jgi:septal ring factor EnvC (AmiA/AmiB activator)
MNIYEELRRLQLSSDKRVNDLEDEVRELRRQLAERDHQLQQTMELNRTLEAERGRVDSGLVAEIAQLRQSNARLRESLDALINQEPEQQSSTGRASSKKLPYIAPEKELGPAAAVSLDLDEADPSTWTVRPPQPDLSQESGEVQFKIDQQLLSMNQKLLSLGEEREREFAAYVTRVGESKLATHFASAILPLKFDDVLMAENKALKEKLSRTQDFLDVARDEIAKWKADLRKLEELEKENSRLRTLVTDKLDCLAGCAGEPLVVTRTEDLDLISRGKQLSEVLEGTFQIKNWFDASRHHSLVELREMCSEFQTAVQYLSKMIDQLKLEIVRQRDDKKRYVREVHRLRVAINALQGLPASASSPSSHPARERDSLVSPAESVPLSSGSSTRSSPATERARILEQLEALEKQMASSPLPSATTAPQSAASAKRTANSSVRR